MSIIKDILTDLYNDLKTVYTEKYTNSKKIDLEPVYNDTDVNSIFAIKQPLNFAPQCHTHQIPVTQIAGTFQNNPGNYTIYAPYMKTLYNDYTISDWGNPNTFVSQIPQIKNLESQKTNFPQIYDITPENNQLTNASSSMNTFAQVQPSNSPSLSQQTYNPSQSSVPQPQPQTYNQLQSQSSISQSETSQQTYNPPQSSVPQPQTSQQRYNQSQASVAQPQTSQQRYNQLQSSQSQSQQTQIAPQPSQSPQAQIAPRPSQSPQAQIDPLPSQSQQAQITPLPSQSSIEPYQQKISDKNFLQNKKNESSSIILPDGRVMIIPDYEDSIGIYDPCTDNFDKISPKDKNSNAISSTNIPIYFSFNVYFPTTSQLNDQFITTIIKIYNMILLYSKINAIIAFQETIDSYLILNAFFPDGNMNMANLFIKLLPKTITFLKFIDPSVYINNITPIQNGIPQSLINTNQIPNILPDDNVLYLTFVLRFPSLQLNTFNQSTLTTIIEIYNSILINSKIDGFISVQNVSSGSVILELNAVFTNGNNKNANDFKNLLPNTLSLLKFIDSHVTILKVSQIMSGLPIIVQKTGTVNSPTPAPSNMSTLYPSSQGLQNAMSPGMQPVAMSPGMQQVAMSPGMQPVAMSPGMQAAAMSPGMQPSTMSPGMQPSTMSPGIQAAAMSPGMQPSTMSPGMQAAAMSPGMQPAAMSPGTQAAAISPGIQAAMPSAPPTMAPAPSPSAFNNPALNVLEFTITFNADYNDVYLLNTTTFINAYNQALKNITNGATINIISVIPGSIKISTQIAFDNVILNQLCTRGDGSICGMIIDILLTKPRTLFISEPLLINLSVSCSDILQTYNYTSVIIPQLNNQSAPAPAPSYNLSIAASPSALFTPYFSSSPSQIQQSPAPSFSQYISQSPSQSPSSIPSSSPQLSPAPFSSINTQVSKDLYTIIYKDKLDDDQAETQPIKHMSDTLANCKIECSKNDNCVGISRHVDDLTIPDANDVIGDCTLLQSPYNLADYGVDSGWTTYIKEMPIMNTLSPSLPNSLPVPAPSPASYSIVPLPSPASNTSKKGFVVGTGSSSKPNIWGTSKITTLHAGWYYTWGMKPLTPAPVGILFTPMFWNIIKCPSCKPISSTYTYAQAVTAAISDLQTLTSLDPSTTENVLLGYNEPDGTNSSASACMLVSDAVAFWYNVINAQVSTFSTPPRIGSPAMYGDLIEISTDAPGTGKNIQNMPQPNGVPSTNTGTYTVQVNISNTTTPNMVTLNPWIWLDNFLIQVSQDYTANPSKYIKRKPFPDFICIHWYNVPNYTSFTTYLTNIYNKYHLPLRITEYSVADWNMNTTTTVPGCQHTNGWDWTFPTTANISTNGTAHFMSQSTSWMNSSQFVEKYTWKERTLLAMGTTSTPIAANDQAAHESATTSQSDPHIEASVKSVLASVASTPITTYAIPTGTTPDNIMSSTNCDVMNQSTLFITYNEFSTQTSTSPPLSPLGSLYSSI